MAPGCCPRPGGLAAVAWVVAGEGGSGLAGLSDDQLVGSSRRRGGWSRGRRGWGWPRPRSSRPAARPLSPGRRAGTPAQQAAEFAADELADELHLTAASAAAQIDYSRTVADRLPQTFAALGAGRIHPVHVRIIQDETSVLNDEDTAKADRLLAAAAVGKTFGELHPGEHHRVAGHHDRPGRDSRRGRRIWPAGRREHPRPDRRRGPALGHPLVPDRGSPDGTAAAHGCLHGRHPRPDRPECAG